MRNENAEMRKKGWELAGCARLGVIGAPLSASFISVFLCRRRERQQI